MCMKLHDCPLTLESDYIERHFLASGLSIFLVASRYMCVPFSESMYTTWGPLPSVCHCVMENIPRRNAS
jgi:hypothetical protein